MTSHHCLLSFDINKCKNLKGLRHALMPCLMLICKLPTASNTTSAIYNVCNNYKSNLKTLPIYLFINGLHYNVINIIVLEMSNLDCMKYLKEIIVCKLSLPYYRFPKSESLMIGPGITIDGQCTNLIGSVR